jgi:uncharacterized cupin superfamily protein
MSETNVHLALMEGKLVSPIVASKTDVPLEPSPIQPSWILEGRPSARSLELSRSEDGRARTLVWECTEGRFNWSYEADETICILEGSVVIEAETMKPTQFGPGDVVLFRRGARATWQVERYIRKLAFIRDPDAPLMVKAIRRIRRLFQSKGSLE